MHESPKACFSISNVSLPVLPNLTQNLMNTLCSSTSAIQPISENRRRLMQYTHKDTCNNQTLSHPTTPLGTLIHKTPPQHTLARNSWTTCDLRVMSIVLGLLDTPSYLPSFSSEIKNGKDYAPTSPIRYHGFVLNYSTGTRLNFTAAILTYRVSTF